MCCGPVLFGPERSCVRWWRRTMTDDQFDELARKTLAYEAGPPNEAVWKQVKPVRWAWLPTVREILVCGAVCGLALVCVRFWSGQARRVDVEPNTVIESAINDQPSEILASVTWGEQPP